MKNKTYQMMSISHHNKTLFVNNDGKKRLSEQKGLASRLLMLFIIGGLGYGAFIAKNKGLISVEKTQTFVNKLSDKVEGKITTDSGFSGYGVQLIATQKLDQAKGIMNDFARDGYSAFVVKSKARGRSIYKVRLGPYLFKPEAVAVQDKVERRYPNNPYVKSSLVIYKPN